MRSKPAADPDRPQFPEVAAAIGEDPARFLLVETQFALARIDGIDHVDVAREWIPVVVELEADGYLSESEREVLVGSLNRRIQYLQDGNERPCDAELRRVAEAQRAQRTAEPDQDDGDDARERPLSAQEKLARIRSGEFHGQQAATDGGESR